MFKIAGQCLGIFETGVLFTCRVVVVDRWKGGQGDTKMKAI
jgi:hypothetical protein